MTYIRDHDFLSCPRPNICPSLQHQTPWLQDFACRFGFAACSNIWTLLLDKKDICNFSNDSKWATCKKRCKASNSYYNQRDICRSCQHRACTSQEACCQPVLQLPHSFIQRLRLITVQSARIVLHLGSVGGVSLYFLKCCWHHNKQFCWVFSHGHRPWHESWLQVESPSVQCQQDNPR